MSKHSQAEMNITFDSFITDKKQIYSDEKVNHIIPGLRIICRAYIRTAKSGKGIVCWLRSC